MGEGSAHEARQALAALLDGAGDEIDLPRAALLVAREEYPWLDVESQLVEVSRLGDALRARLAGAAGPEQQVEALSNLLFGEMRFRGNVEDYYDPRNSYLNEVLERRTGLPITLSLLYVAVGRRAGMPLHGIGFPSHFLVGYGDEVPPRLLIDPFHQGRLLTPRDAAALLRASHGPGARLHPSHLLPSSPRRVLARILTNLKVAYLRRNDLARAIRASEQLSLVQPGAAELRDRGLLRARTGDVRTAADELKAYLEQAPNASDVDAVRTHLQLVESLWARRN